MTSTHTQAGWAKTAVRLPRELHQQVHAAAKAEGRSFNGQLVALIRESVQARTKPAILTPSQQPQEVQA